MLSAHSGSSLAEDLAARTLCGEDLGELTYLVPKLTMGDQVGSHLICLCFAWFQSPPYSSGSYDSIKTEVSGCPEDLTVGRAPAADDDDDDHDDHEDNDKMNDSEGMDPERLKAFNVSTMEGWWDMDGSKAGPAPPMACLSPDVCAAVRG